MPQRASGPEKLAKTARSGGKLALACDPFFKREDFPCTGDIWVDNFGANPEIPVTNVLTLNQANSESCWVSLYARGSIHVYIVKEEICKISNPTLVLGHRRQSDLSFTKLA